MILDSLSLSGKDAYFLMTALIGPRPIAWVSTHDREGRPNLAPFSYFMGVGSKPPMLAVSIGDRAGGQPKDSARNIRETGVFVVNVVTRELADAMSASATDLPHGESEFALAGVTAIPGTKVSAPRVQEAPAAMECEVHDMLRPGGNAITVCFGRIVCFHVEDALLDAQGRVDQTKLPLVGRLGGDWYSATAGALFDLKRPS